MDLLDLTNPAILAPAVAAVTAWVGERLNLKGNALVACAFIVSGVLYGAGLASETWPEVLNHVRNVILGATISGGVVDLYRKASKPSVRIEEGPTEVNVNSGLPGSERE